MLRIAVRTKRSGSQILIDATGFEPLRNDIGEMSAFLMDLSGPFWLVRASQRNQTGFEEQLGVARVPIVGPGARVLVSPAVLSNVSEAIGRYWQCDPGRWYFAGEFCPSSMLEAGPTNAHSAWRSSRWARKAAKACGFAGVSYDDNIVDLRTSTDLNRVAQIIRPRFSRAQVSFGEFQ